MSMRIVGGKFKGRKLLPLHGSNTRPTSGLVREAIFNICADRIRNARVLDLFAGTGAFGLEAISRGAASAVFVDSDKRAVDLILKNIAACRAEEAAMVFKWDIVVNLKCLARCDEPFDLIFMDPPYRRDVTGAALKNLQRAGALSPGALLIVEHSVERSITGVEPPFSILDQRKYGKTLVTFISYMIDNESEHITGSEPEF